MKNVISRDDAKKLIQEAFTPHEIRFEGKEYDPLSVCVYRKDRERVILRPITHTDLTNKERLIKTIEQWKTLVV